MSLAAREHSLREAISHKTGELMRHLSNLAPILESYYHLMAEIENLLVELEDLKTERTAEDRKRER